MGRPLKQGIFLSETTFKLSWCYYKGLPIFAYKGTTFTTFYRGNLVQPLHSLNTKVIIEYENYEIKEFSRNQAITFLSINIKL